ncbi:uncharacterized protein LOC100372754 [Saccoglossus kowalevskii]|uniref:Uncharacterized protein LOC100372754 n=1 Tax=Saccoglossus kowalevskii TaxID=10224 RepID=A0ABM0GK46_SACKO|nr:PREDICTED: uncharacterized protein LOC100372754 [Saccoglossus kowalevskii]
MSGTRCIVLWMILCMCMNVTCRSFLKVETFGNSYSDGDGRNWRTSASPYNTVIDRLGDEEHGWTETDLNAASLLDLGRDGYFQNDRIDDHYRRNAFHLLSPGQQIYSRKGANEQINVRKHQSKLKNRRPINTYTSDHVPVEAKRGRARNHGPVFHNHQYNSPHTVSRVPLLLKGLNMNDVW